MKTVITGGAGFIGSHLADELARRGDLTIIDDLTTGRRQNLEALIGKSNVRFIDGTIMDLELLRREFQGADFIFHQAAIPSVPRSIEDPLSVNDVNIGGTLNVLVAARDNRAKKVVFASSSSVYGDTVELPKKESMAPNPQSPYALTKMVGEYYCKIFTQIYGLPAVSLRYFNVYGPRQRADSAYSAVIPRFVACLRQNLQPIIFGDGTQTRDFTFVEDVVTANILAAESAPSGVYNIGGGKRTSVLELSITIGDILKKHVSPEFKALRLGDVRDSFASIEAARSFGYQPNYNLEEGLIKTIRGESDASRF